MAWGMAVPIIGKVIDKIFPDPEQRDKAKLALLQMEQEGELQEIATKAGVVTAEIQGESWLQRNWRPVLMLSIVGIVVNNYLIYPYLLLFSPQAALQLDLPAPLWNLMHIGVGGYVAGRSAEKALSIWKTGEPPK